jgi:tetratricopeptide (TPR) repeat protein
MSLNQGTKEVVTFDVDANGDFTGSAPPGTYTLIYRTPGMPKDKVADKFENIKITVGQDTVADDDMSRKEYIDALPAETRKQLEEMRQHNAEALKTNAVIKALNNDLKTVIADIHDADAAHNSAAQQLGASAAKADIVAKENEIKTQKYTDIVNLMTKDSQLRPTESVIWAYLGQGQMGLKKYDDAETSFKKALELDTASKKPRPDIEGLANAGLGEIYARTNKVDQANAAYDAAVKADPTKAAFYYKNEAVIYSQVGNTDAQQAAADKAIQANPNDPIPYYLKGQSLIAKASVDPKTQRIVLPPGCGEAYQKYLELDPNGPYSADVKGILDSAGQKVASTYKASSTKKK